MSKSYKINITVGAKTGVAEEMIDTISDDTYGVSFVNKKDRQKIILRLVAAIRQDLSDKELLKLAKVLKIKL